MATFPWKHVSSQASSREEVDDSRETRSAEAHPKGSGKAFSKAAGVLEPDGGTSCFTRQERGQEEVHGCRFIQRGVEATQLRVLDEAGHVLVCQSEASRVAQSVECQT